MTSFHRTFAPVLDSSFSVSCRNWSKHDAAPASGDRESPVRDDTVFDDGYILGGLTYPLRHEPHVDAGITSVIVHGGQRADVDERCARLPTLWAGTNRLDLHDGHPRENIDTSLRTSVRVAAGLQVKQRPGRRSQFFWHEPDMFANCARELLHMIR